MNDINMSTINDALIGIDKNHTVNAFYIRDKLMNLNTNFQIINTMKKLGYYNIDIIVETKKFILDNIAKKIIIELNNNWDSSIKSKTVDNIIVEIKESLDYKLFIVMLNKKIGRAMELSKFVNYTDTCDFYNGLTLEELQFIGY